MNKPILTFTIIAIGLLLATTTGPVIAESTSNIVVTNKSGDVFDFTYQQLLAMPKTTVNADLYCYGSLVTYGNWSGILLSYLLTQAQLTPEVSSIEFMASDGYRVAIPVDLAMQPQIIIAYELNGNPLSEGLRLILPGANGAAWIAMITSITMSPSRVDYPAPATVGGSAMTDLGKVTSGYQPKWQEQPTPQPTTTPNSTPNNSSSIQTTPPANVTDSNQPTPKPQSSNNEAASLDALLLTVIASISILILSAAGYLTYKRKQNPMRN